MSKQLTYQLFELIKSLSKAEKRSFKLYAKRNLSEKEFLFIQLFDVIDKMKVCDEQIINQKIPQLKGNLLSNQKANLYEQLLMSLRLLNHKTPSIRIKEIISFANVLHEKGLYQQSLNQLTKAKQLSTINHTDILHLEILSLEKQIEASYITRSHQKRATELINETLLVRAAIKIEGDWSDLALKMYDYYLKFGHIKHKSDYSKIVTFFNENLPENQDSRGSFYAGIYKHQSYVWFNYIIQDFRLCYKHSIKWIKCFDAFPELKKNKPILYMKGLHNCLSALFYCDDAIRFEKQLAILSDFVATNEANFKENQRNIAFIYLETAQLNLFFLKGEFTEGAAYSSTFENKLSQYEKQIDIHRILIFNYKIACLKFGSDDYKGAIKHLNFILNHQSFSLREDIQCFARILNLIAHYELGNNELIEYQIKSTYKFLLKLDDMQKVQQAVLHFLKKSIYMDKNELTPYFLELKTELEHVLEDKYERRPTLYLDIISWLESKITGNTVENIIKQKKAISPLK